MQKEREHKILVFLSVIMILLLLGNLYTNIKILQILQGSQNPDLGPKIAGTLTPPVVYVIEFSGVDGQDVNDLQGIAVTIAPTASPGYVEAFGLVLYDPQLGRIVDPLTLTQEQIDTYLGSVVYNGQSEFFFGSTDAALYLAADGNRLNFVKELLPGVETRVAELISADINSNILPMMAMSHIGFNHPPGGIEEALRRICERYAGNCKILDEIKKYNPTRWDRFKTNWYEWSRWHWAKGYTGPQVAARLGVVALAAVAGAACGYFCIYQPFIAPTLECPDNPPPYDCDARHAECTSNYNRIGRSDLNYLCDQGKEACQRYVAELDRRANEANEEVCNGACCSY